MRSNTLSKYKILTAIALSGLFLGACAQVNDPWKDSSVAINEDMHTPSADAYTKGGPAEISETRRVWPASSVEAHNGAVTHWPLWFEDPFEDRGNTDVAMKCPDLERDLPDNVFAVNWVDYFDIAYGPARQVLNIVGWPVSAVVTPPGTLMESDGHISRGLWGYDFDSRRAPADAEPPDVAALNPTYSHPEVKPTPAPTSGDR